MLCFTPGAILHGFFLSLSKLMAVLGGIVLSILILLICVSIIGRTIGIGPINGDYELVEAGIAFSIFAFLPLTQITASHATVDIFTNSLPPKIQRLLLAVIEIFFAAMLVMVAWQLREGMFDKLERGQTTFLLQFPVWWAYALSVFGACAAAIVGTYTAFARVYEAFTGIQILESEGAEH